MQTQGTSLVWFIMAAPSKLLLKGEQAGVLQQAEDIVESKRCCRMSISRTKQWWRARGGGGGGEWVWGWEREAGEARYTVGEVEGGAGTSGRCV